MNRIQLLSAVMLLFAGCQNTLRVEQRKEVTYLRGPYNTAFFHRHNATQRAQAAFHYHHAKQHDLLQMTPLADREKVDAEFDQRVMSFALNESIPIGPEMEFFGPYAGRIAFKMYRAMDWTHMHHEQTYDILSEDKIAWNKKKEWTDRAVNYYLEKNKDVALSVAPIDITMRRAAVMMKPYFTFYRNYYPKSNGDAWVAHWWHPVIYEAQILAGNDKEQEAALNKISELMRQVFSDRPQRMLLSRELMPRYSQLTPESANIFDNLHMLHGIIFDIFSFEGWTKKQKQDEIYRVINAFVYQPGDEKYVRKFSLPHPEMSPLTYESWMKTTDGEMNRIMMEMMDEMMPMMMLEGMNNEMKEKMMAQFKMKMSPGMQDGEFEGSLHDAMMKLMPDMKMMPESMEPGKSAHKMVEMMLKGWEQKYGNMKDIDTYDMSAEPALSIR